MANREIEDDAPQQAPPAEGDSEPKGKSPKLLILILVAVLLAGGGFFGMKIMKAGKKPEAAKVGEIVELPEFLVNLSDQQTFLRTNIALGLKEKFKKEELDKKMPAVKDAIVMILTGKRPSQLVSAKGKELLKAELLAAINAALEPKESGTSADTNTDSPEKNSSPGKKKAEEKKGPVLEVYLTSFATQKY